MMFTIAQARKYAGLTQEDIAKKLEIDRGTYIKIEKDPSRATVKQIGEISRITGIEIRDFLLPFDSTNVDTGVTA